MSDILRAAKFAKAAHYGQLRKWPITYTPYIEHPAKVAARVSLLDGIEEADVCAAWLHDVMEDCGVTRETLYHNFGSVIADLVKELTNISKQSINGVIPSRAVRKQLDYDRLANASKRAKRIKLCDRIENVLDTLIYVDDPKWALQYMSESLDLVNNCLLHVDVSLEVILMRLIQEVNNKYGDGRH